MSATLALEKTSANFYKKLPMPCHSIIGVARFSFFLLFSSFLTEFVSFVSHKVIVKIITIVINVVFIPQKLIFFQNRSKINFNKKINFLPNEQIHSFCDFSHNF